VKNVKKKKNTHTQNETPLCHYELNAFLKLYKNNETCFIFGFILLTSYIFLVICYHKNLHLKTK